MSAEASVIGVVIIKTVVGAIAAYLVALFGWVTRSNHIKLKNTLTKKETEKLIDDKVTPVKEMIDMKLDALIKSNESASEERKETKSMLQGIKTDVAVVKNEVSHLKERLDKENI